MVESNPTESQIEALADAVEKERSEVPAERRHCSKSAAVEWALSREPSLPAVHQALRRRHFDPAALIAEAPVRELLAFVRKRVAEAAGPRG